MLKQKKITIAAVVLLAAVSSLIIFALANAKTPIMSDYPYYNSMSQICERADLIIRGEVVSSHNVKNLKADSSSGTDYEYTISKVKITVVVKGDAEVGDIIDIKQRGDYKHSPDSYLDANDGYLKDGQDGIMFLCTYGNEVPASFVNPSQGFVEIVDGKLCLSEQDVIFTTEQTKLEEVEIAVEEIKKYI